LPVKTNKAFSSAIVNHSSNLVLNLKQSSTSTFKPRNICSDIPIIENSKPTKNMNWSNITESKYWICISIFDLKYIHNYLLEYYLILNSKV